MAEGLEAECQAVTANPNIVMGDGWFIQWGYATANDFAVSQLPSETHLFYCQE